MIEIGNLSEFNQARCREITACNNTEIVAILSENDGRFPNIYLLLTETTRFYTECFSELQRYIKREKRLVVFETPSRVAITHEYTVEGIGGLTQGFHFLFNTRERLSWLKIFLEDKRVSIASRAKVESLLVKKLGAELEEFSLLLHTTTEDAAKRLYEASDGKPCFVEYNQKELKGQQSLLLSVTFFDSIRNKKTHHWKRWWSPLQEKEITYNYSTISENANAWIYFKSPANFVLDVSHTAKENHVEASPSNDDEITSLVLTPMGEKLSVDFMISINVPNALKVWYNVMLYMSCIGVLWGLGLLILGQYDFISDKMIETFSNCSYAIMAAIIATRGWLMSEEQVMKKISNCYTAIIGILIVLVIVLTSMSNLKSANINEQLNSKPHNSLPQDRNNVNTNSDNTIVNFNHDHTKANGKLNDTNGKKGKFCDSLSKRPQDIKSNKENGNCYDKSTR